MTTSIPDLAFAILTAHREGRTKLTRRSGQFCGQLVADSAMLLSDAQNDWLQLLAQRAGLEVEHA